MILPFKPIVATKLSALDRVTYSATASVSFETIDTTVKGDGSEVYDYEFFVRHDGTCNIHMVLNNLTSYSQDYMQGRSSTPSAVVTPTVTSIPILICDNATYTSFTKIKITGYIGNKRHIQVFTCGHDGATLTRISSFYTADTSSEITSVSFFNTTSQTVTFTCVGFAVPKIQYNPHAILLKHKKLTNQTADIIFGGVNDTEGVDYLDGDVYEYYLASNLNTSSNDTLRVYINEDLVSDKTNQQLYNTSGTLLSINFTSDRNATLHTSNCKISAQTGRKKLVENSYSTVVGTQQIEELILDPDTSTKMTSLMLRPSASLSGNIWLYAVPKGYNADLTPWTFRQEVDINGDFSSGHSFEIPDWAIFARIQVTGESTIGSDIELDFDTTTVLDKQYLKSSTSSTTALFATNRTIGRIEKVSTIDCIVALKSGSNRPILSKSNYNENTIDLNALWAKDSSTNYTSLKLKSNNTNNMTSEFVVSFI